VITISHPGGKAILQLLPAKLHDKRLCSIHFQRNKFNLPVVWVIRGLLIIITFGGVPVNNKNSHIQFILVTDTDITPLRNHKTQVSPYKIPKKQHHRSMVTGKWRSKLAKKLHVLYLRNILYASFELLIDRMYKGKQFKSVWASCNWPSSISDYHITKFPPKWEGGGGNLYGLYKCVWPHRVWFFSHLGHK